MAGLERDHVDLRTLLACGVAAAAMSCAALAAQPGRVALPSRAALPVRPALPVAGDMSVTPGTVIAGVPATLVFTFTTSVSFDGGTVSLTVPPGWTNPSATVGGAGYASAAYPPAECVSPNPAACSLPVNVSGGMISVSNLILNAKRPVMTVTYSSARAGGSASGDFTATAQAPTADGEQYGISVAPVTVTLCADGAGTMTVSPTSTAAASASPLAFTYQAAGCGVEPGGMVTLTVPPSWPQPAQVAGAPGYTTVSGAGPPQVSGHVIAESFPDTGLLPGESFTIDYAPGKAPAVPGSYTFAAAEQSTSAGQLAALANGSPAITVTAVSASPGQSSGTSTPTPTGSAAPASTGPGGTSRPGPGTMTVRPQAVAASRYSTLTFTYTAGPSGLAPSGAVAVQVPAGWTTPSAIPGAAGYTRPGAGRLALSAGRIMVTGAALRSGQALTISYRGQPGPGPARTATFVTSAQSDATTVLTALATSPSVSVSPASPPARSISLLALGLAAAVCAAVYAVAAPAVRRVRRGRRVMAGPSVRAAAQPGPLPSLTVRDTGPRPTLTVRIEPHASAAVTTLEEVRS